MPDYTTLKSLSQNGETFTIQKVWGYKWKKWDNESKRVVTSEKYEKGFSKVYEVDTNKGKLDLRSNQFASCLEACHKGGQADVVGKTFEVKNNGKTGIEIRYFINLVILEAPQNKEDVKENIDVEDMPF